MRFFAFWSPYYFLLILFQWLISLPKDTEFQLEDQEHYVNWIEGIITGFGKQLEEINYIFCSDTYLHQVNVEYLDHDTYTDIITFDNSEAEEMIESDIFISIDRVGENAKEIGVSFMRELQRVMAHGVLHLIGYKDKSPEEAQEMRKQEEYCMNKFPNTWNK